MMMMMMMMMMMTVTATKVLSFWQQHAIPFEPKGNILHPVFGAVVISVMFLLCSCCAVDSFRRKKSHRYLMRWINKR